MCDKLVREIELKIKNNELKNEKELEKYLAEYQYRGILTKMEVDSLTKKLSKLYGNSNQQATSKRVTRTPQNRFFQ